MKKIISFKQTQKGATLAIALIFLLLVTIIGVTSMRTSSFEEKMSYNMSNNEFAFQATESALREAEAWIFAQAVAPVIVTACATKPCVLQPDPNRYPEDENAAWWTATGTTYAGTALNNINTAPVYIIEYSRFVPDSLVVGKGNSTGIHYYKVIARGTGATDDAVTIIESTFSRRFL